MAAATYPALGLAWCVAALFVFHFGQRALGVEEHLGQIAGALLVLMGLLAVGNAVRTVVRGVRQTRRFHTWVVSRRVPIPSSVAVVVNEFGSRAPVTVVDVEQQVAVTVGLLRPSVVISTGLAEILSPAELRAVVAHEQAHAKRRDPLRVLLGQMLAAHLWFLPAAEDMRTRARRSYELAADRDATNRYGQRALAGALLRVLPAAITPGSVAPFADSDLLDARVAQLESGEPPRPHPVSPLRSALTATGACAFLTAVTGAWMFMLIACPCLMT
ncbi:M56 family metallopeptidase [Allosaccharopolyspora coralli]|uniref:M56 family metallopeptidase n=1 Tax=Allosaccharopolyspora coralli TaxID=2665642 RepID=UPI0016523259|nr:M56 family metallopeptidase [Allosaccharopolyspora coralli]